jgi:hypothetical protein
MNKFDEFTKPSSCFNRAHADEMMFILLARDASAPVAVRAWIHHRLKSGKNVEGDPQIEEARHIASEMERYFEKGQRRFHTSQEK